MGNTLAFRNADQVALWKFELAGQLSDGHWENSRPNDHWEAWCQADVIADPTNVGRDFWACRETYNFTSKALLDVVADRMIGNVRLARAVGIEKVEKDLRWCVECNGKLVTYKPIENATELAAILAHETYTRKDLMRDLRDMKVIIKLRRK